MINLLSPDLKTGYTYARRNVVLRKWIIFFAFALVGLGAIATYGLLSLQKSSNDYSRQITALEKQLEEENVTQTKQKVKDISSSLKLTYQVLSKEVLFSKLLVQIGAAMPRGAILTGLNINQTTGGLDLTAAATNYTSATQVQVNLSDPDNKIFEKADLVNIVCDAKGENVNASYPCAVNIRALFSKDNPFLFINQGKQP